MAGPHTSHWRPKGAFVFLVQQEGNISLENKEKNYLIAVPEEIAVEKGGDFDWNLTIQRYDALE